MKRRWLTPFPIPKSCRQPRSNGARRHPHPVSTSFSSCNNGNSTSTSARSCEASGDSGSADKGAMARCYMVQCSISQNKRLGVLLNSKEVQNAAVESVTKDTQLDNCDARNVVEKRDDHVHGHLNEEPSTSSPDTLNLTGKIASWLPPGSVVWMRKSYCEWWPAEVMDEKQALSCSGNRYDEGLVLVQLYGSSDFAWVDPIRDLSPIDNCYEERSKNPSKAFQDALKQALDRKECSCASEQSDKSNASNLRMDDDNAVEGRGRRTRKTKIFFDELAFSKRSMRKVNRRMRIMRYLGLTAPVGSPFARSQARSDF